MKRNRFTEEQIIGILREQEAGAKTADNLASNPGIKFHGEHPSSPSMPSKGIETA
jgi:hypothetical protein